MKYAVVLGYGLFDESDEKYRKYLDSFVKFVNREKSDVVVLSGGYTSPKRKKESEASTMAGYIRPLLKKKADVVLEDRSISTVQNIEFVGRLVHLGKRDEITVFCDNIRPPRVMWFILHYWFRLNAKRIEKYFINYAVRHYRKHYTTESMGKEMAKGLKYGNVNVKAYPLRTNIEEAVSNQVATTMEILSLYDKELYEVLDEATRVKHGI